MIIRKCPFCRRELKNGSSHIYKCDKNTYKYDKDKTKFLYINYNFPEITDSKNLEEEYVVNNLSLPDIKTKYGIDFKSVIFLLNNFNIKRRSSSESAKSISVPKQRKTIMDKHGVKWSSQLESVKELKRNNNLEKFGVDNIWKSDWFKENRDNFFIEKHGLSVSEYNKLHWLSLSENEQRNHMINSVQKSSIESSIELRIKSLLDMMYIQYTSQMKLKSSKNSLYFFDICIGDILIEINGDFWHANPNKYKKGDILKFPKKEVSSDELWLKDKIKKKDAIKKGYNVVYLWESFIRKSSNEELIETLKDIIENKNYKDRNYEHIKVKS
jgi:hypothetical protein